MAGRALAASLALATLLSCAPETSTAGAAQSASLHVTLTPEKPGRETTLGLAFNVSAPDGQIPSPLTAITLRMPRNLGIATSGLGTATCTPTRIETSGPGACPANSRMGAGHARVRFQVGPQQFSEDAQISVLAGPEQEGHIRMLVTATGETPVAARILISTVLSAGQLQITVPLVPSLPEGGDIAVVAVNATLGGKLTYKETRHGHTVSYHPRGITLPNSCPRGGYAFTATFSFLDASHSNARSAVPCPRRRHG